MGTYLDLQLLKQDLNTELISILDYWSKHCADLENGGFYGQINNLNQVNKVAPKGLILHARIVWSFAAAYRLNARLSDLEMADRAFNFLMNHFLDKQNGGMFWSIRADQEPLDSKKQAYALAFVIYGCSEYFLATGNEQSKLMAIDLFKKLEEHFWDPVDGGYIEAKTAKWEQLQDLRLSDKDANEPKTMNTHLHILEAYTNLYRIWPDSSVRSKIIQLLWIFSEKILAKDTGHLQLFFSMHWSVKSDIISYGHDIEAAWLLLEAAEVVKDEVLINLFRQNSVRMAEVTLSGLDIDGGLWYESDPSSGHMLKEKHWWPQAEAMVGFFTAWQVSGELKWLEFTLSSWKFIKNKIIDKERGEWFWGIDHTGKILDKEDKAGFWKCPYHNGRACLELIHRIP